MRASIVLFALVLTAGCGSDAKPIVVPVSFSVVTPTTEVTTQCSDLPAKGAAGLTEYLDRGCTTKDGSSMSIGRNEYPCENGTGSVSSVDIGVSYLVGPDGVWHEASGFTSDDVQAFCT